MNDVRGLRPVWEPQPKQGVALTCPAFELLFGGSKGGGKTGLLVACVAPILQLAHQKYLKTRQKQYKCRIIVFRKNLEDLQDFIVKSHEIYPYLDQEMGTSGYNKNEKTWHFTSGATVQMRHLDGPTDHLGYNGHEFVAVLFDEVQFIPYEAYSFLIAQVRSSDPDYRKALMVRCTANPGGPHGDWVAKHFFIDECPAGGKIFKVKTKLPDGREIETTRAFIRSYLRDNKYIDPDGTYEARLRATMNEDEVAMYLDGDFNRVAGSFFSKLLRPSLHFQKSRPIPGDWEMRSATDWGSTNPASWHLGARDNDNRLYVIDELHTPGITGRRFGELLNEKFAGQKWSNEKRWKNDEFWGVIDKQAMDRYGSEETAAAGIMDWGFRLFPAKKDRVAGVNQMKERLLLDRFGSPQLIIFEDRCPQLVAALSKISSNAPADPDDYASNSSWSHACFIAGTMVRTPSGERPIETLRPGGEVITDLGPRPIEACGLTSPSEDVYTVAFDDGTSLTGTGNHPVFMADGNKRRLDSLRFLDNVSAWENPQVSTLSLTEWNTPGIQGLPTDRPASISGPLARGTGTWTGSIVRFGNSTTALSRAAITFITSTTTRATTGLRTSLASLARTICHITDGLIPETSPRLPGRRLPNGTGQARAATRHTSALESSDGRAASRSIIRSAAGAAANSWPFIPGQSGVRRSAKTLPPGAQASTRRLGAASSVGRNFEPENIQSPGLVTKTVLRISHGGRAAVYNLTVADRHRYFANGVLVSNCDSFRFLAMEFPVRYEKEKNAMDLEVERWNAVLRRRKEAENDAGRGSMTGGYDG